MGESNHLTMLQQPNERTKGMEHAKAIAYGVMARLLPDGVRDDDAVVVDATGEGVNFNVMPRKDLPAVIVERFPQLAGHAKDFEQAQGAGWDRFNWVVVAVKSTNGYGLACVCAGWCNVRVTQQSVGIA